MKAMENNWVPESFRIPDKTKGDEKSVYMRFTCRTAATAAILRQAMEDRAAIDGIPVYSAFEDALMEASFPKDNFARAFTQLVIGEQAGIWEPIHEGVPPVQHALFKVFEALADLDNGLWKLPETEELVLYAGAYVEVKDLRAYAVNDHEGVVSSALDAAEQAIAEQADALGPMEESERSARFHLLRTLFSGEVEEGWRELGNFEADILFSPLVDVWEDAWALPEVRNLVLALLKTPMGGKDSVKDRVEFAAVCRIAMPAWTRESVKRETELKRESSRAMLKERKIKGGVLMHPSTWKIANPEWAEEWGEAASVSVVRAISAEPAASLEDVDEATRIALLPCPFENVGSTEEERSRRVIEMAGKSWPDLPKILNAKVELEYAKNGKPLNWDEWKTSLRLKVSKVPEIVSAASAATNGYEAWIEEDDPEKMPFWPFFYNATQ